MFVIAGLGNPGSRHVANRHNVGFMAADAIHRRHGFSPWTRKFQAELASGEIEGEKVLLVKPQTYMNLSGQAVGEVLRFYRLDPSRLIVIHDELDLAPGRVRVKTGGGHGGHNGLKSVDAHCGNAYRRLRIGIGHPGAREQVQGHVLSDFSRADRQWLEPLLKAVADHVGLLLRGDEAGFMNRVSLAVPAPSAKTSAAGPAQPGPMAAMLKRLFGRN
jgi:PTH1 family peptidyl-tRNA hydrolase